VISVDAFPHSLGSVVRYPAKAQSKSCVSLKNLTSRKTPVLTPVKTTVLVGSVASSGIHRIDKRKDRKAAGSVDIPDSLMSAIKC
jgi:hypothetical protein